MRQCITEHQPSLVHHYCDTFYAPQQANINSYTVQQNKIKSTVGYAQTLTTRLGRLGQIIPSGQPLATNTVVEPGPPNTHQSLRSHWEMVMKLRCHTEGSETTQSHGYPCAADFINTLERFIIITVPMHHTLKDIKLIKLPNLRIIIQSRKPEIAV